MNKEQTIQHLKQQGLWAKKGLGQNFLVDENALSKIVEAAELKKDDTVLEIGPGLGVLTERLAGSAGKVIAIEKDEKLADILNNKFLISNSKLKDKIQIITGDALDFDPSTLLSHPEVTEGSAQIDSSLVAQNDTIKKAQNDKKVNYKLVANIPYYITGKIIEKYLTAENRPSLLVLLVQKEVAERVCAVPGQMSILSVSVQLYGKPEIVSIVPASSFFPSPKVDSAIIKIRTRHPQKDFTEGTQKEFFKYVKMGFGSKRRTLVNNLSGGLHVPKENIDSLLKELKINPMARAQELSIENWISLAEKLKEL